jgi:hypothetical protein
VTGVLRSVPAMRKKRTRATEKLNISERAGSHPCFSGASHASLSQ